MSDVMLQSLLEATRAVLRLESFERAARVVFDQACKLTGARSGYIALLSADGQENEVLFLEAGGMACSVDPSLPMPIRGLRAEAYASRQTVWDNDFMASEWRQFLPEGHVDLTNAMFAPLVIDGQVRGIMGLANKEGDFTAADAELAAEFGALVALALRNSRTLDELHDTVTRLGEARREVKALRGLIPICSKCRKLKDEEGYWRSLEEYLHEHGEILLTHGLCAPCARELYGDLASEKR